MMQFAHGPLQKTKGLLLYKLMGSGKQLGFNPLPDWSTYAMLKIWRNKEDAESFWTNSKLASQYKKRSSAQWSIRMQVIKSHGEWGGSNIFEPYLIADISPARIAVLTRATIKRSKLRVFWKSVPNAQKGIFTSQKLQYTKGIGEIPFINMATFSIWDSLEALNDFAYRSKGHKQAIKLTKELSWYSEELFARFAILEEKGDSSVFVADFKEHLAIE